MYVYFNYEVVFKLMFDHVFVFFTMVALARTHTDTQNTQIHSRTSRSSSVNSLLPSMLEQSHIA